MHGNSTLIPKKNLIEIMKFSLLTVILLMINCSYEAGITRESCFHTKGQLLQPITIQRRRLHELRELMLMRSSLQGPIINGYVLPPFDENLNIDLANRDKRIEYLTGFTGISTGFVAVTLKDAALWTNLPNLRQADLETHCEWEIFDISGNVSITEWFSKKLHADGRIGIDPHLVPHSTFTELHAELSRNFLYLIKINANLVDLIWINRPPPDDITIKVHEVRFAGEKWQDKVIRLREEIRKHENDAIIVTSLSDVAYILNIRGRDIPYSPLIKAYILITQDSIYLYVDKSKVSITILLHLKTDFCHKEMCVQIREYNDIWKDLSAYNQRRRKIIIPAPCTFDRGVSEAIWSGIPRHYINEIISPIIYMKAQKNFIEREGMKIASIRDGAAICEAMSKLEQRFAGGLWTELNVTYEIDLSRLSQPHNKGRSQPTIVAYGEHASHPFYIQSNATNARVTEESTLIIESGGQYLEGTTDVSRTYHFGNPNEEQRTAYTNVLRGVINISNLKFPADLRPSEIDALVRSPVWGLGGLGDYPQSTGHGVGSYSTIQEPPIDMKYHDKNAEFNFKEGYFFSNEPGFYKKGDFGIRLGNILEVVDTGTYHPSGVKFLKFEVVTLVPYEDKFIDRKLLSAQDKRWLNEYNAKVRQHVGEELKRLGNMNAFYWMMNKTRHVREYLTEDEYLRNNSISCFGLNSTKFINFSIFIPFIVFFFFS